MDTTEVMFHLPFNRETQYIQVWAQDILCALELSRVERVVSLMALKPMPSTPSYLVGLFDYHGIMIPVMDLSARLGQTVTVVYNINSSVVLYETAERETLVGLIVDNVDSVIEINQTDLQLVPELAGKQSLIHACYKNDSNVCFLLDSDALLDSSLSNIGAVMPTEIKAIIDGFRGNNKN